MPRQINRTDLPRQKPVNRSNLRDNGTQALSHNDICACVGDDDRITIRFASEMIIPAMSSILTSSTSQERGVNAVRDALVYRRKWPIDASNGLNRN